MRPLLWGIACVAISFAIHIILWRWRLPERHTRILLILFLAPPFALAGCSLIVGRHYAAALRLLVAPAECFEVVLFDIAFALAYIITYSAIEADSPSLVLTTAIADAGPAGALESDLVKLASDDVLIRPRIADLLRDQLVISHDAGFAITAKGRRLVRIILLARSLMGAGKGG